MHAYIVTAANRASYEPVLEEMFRQRREPPGRDEFDTDDAAYILVVNDVGDLEASVRLIPSWRPNAAHAFAASFGADDAPSDPRTWEWSRYMPGRSGVSAGRAEESRAALIAGALEFALSRRIAGFIACCPMTEFDALSGLGWDMRLLSGPTDTGGDRMALITWRVGEQDLAEARRRFGLTRSVSIETPPQPEPHALSALHFAAISELLQIEDGERLGSALMAISGHALREPDADDRNPPPASSILRPARADDEFA